MHKINPAASMTSLYLYKYKKVKHLLSGFTLTEMLVVIGILAIMSVAVLVILNPADISRQSRDAQRVAEMNTLDRALAFYDVDTQGKNAYYGEVSTTYVSLVDNTATTTSGTDCSSLGLPALPPGQTYHCVYPPNLRNIDGTGWIPVNFSVLGSSPISKLPIDPTNDPASGLYYTYQHGSWELSTGLESKTYIERHSGHFVGIYQVGSDNALLQINRIFLANTTTPDITAPSVPTGLIAVAASSTTIDLSWTASTDNVGVAGYKIYKNEIQIGFSVSTSYLVTGLSAGTNYTFTVSAYDETGNTSAQSASASATTQSIIPNPPLLNSITATQSPIGLSWSSISGASYYMIYRRAPAGSGTWPTIATAANITGTSWGDTAVSPGVSYEYYVTSCNSTGSCSNPSNYQSVTVAGGQLPVPTSVKSTVPKTCCGPNLKYQHDIRFSYDLGSISQVQLFRLYEKVPGWTDYSVVATFSNPGLYLNSTHAPNDCYSTGSAGSWHCYGLSGGSWEIISVLQSSANFPVGRYDFYVTAVDSNGIEGPASAVVNTQILDKATISSPIGVITSATPTISYRVASGWPISTVQYHIVVYDGTTLVYSAARNVSPASLTQDTFTYAGPALSPGKTYMIYASAGPTVWSLSTTPITPYAAMEDAVNFSIGEIADTQPP